MKVFVLAPHPDDEILGAGGSIACHVAKGDEVHIGILTRGNPTIYGDEAIARVRTEALQAHRLLGVTSTLFCDELPAPGLDSVPCHLVADKIRSWLQEIKPALLYTPHAGDMHLDHRVAHHAALVAARPGNHGIVRILSYETLSETEWSGPSLDVAFVPNVFRDISPYLERKLAAMRLYQSQEKEFPHPRSIRAIEALARLRGSTVQVQAAEAFVLVREVLDCT